RNTIKILVNIVRITNIEARKSVTLYQARFLPTGTLQTIVQHCPNVTELELNLNEWIRPDHLEYLQKRCAAFASLISSLPSSLWVLDFEGERDGPWKPCMSALNLIPSGIDSLSDNLREFSTHLRELKFKCTLSHLASYTLMPFR
ncbi:hypothetical protein N7522_006820, partial [Penicillium canescens]